MSRHLLRWLHTKLRKQIDEHWLSISDKYSKHFKFFVASKEVTKTKLKKTAKNIWEKHLCNKLYIGAILTGGR